jgi:AcrR family transcriptional regulator
MQAPHTGRSRRWRRRANARPSEILAAALEEFTANGFEAARVEDIASRAGLSKAAVYLYFQSKEALLDALIEKEVAPIADGMQRIAEGGQADPEGTLRRVGNLAGAAFKNPHFFAVPRLVISVGPRFPELAERYRLRVVVPAREAIERLVEHGIAVGRFRDIDPGAVSRALIGPVMFEALWTHGLGGAPRPNTSWMSDQIEILLHGISNSRETLKV